jgi:ferredoxin-NADP reductase
MIRHRSHAEKKVPTRLLYSSRSVEDVIYREELELLARNDSSLQVIHTLTRRQPESWTGYNRRIDREMLAETAFHSAEKPLAFACGPTAMIEAVATYLLELGYEPERVRTERFGPTGN